MASKYRLDKTFFATLIVSVLLSSAGVQQSVIGFEVSDDTGEKIDPQKKDEITGKWTMLKK